MTGSMTIGAILAAMAVVALLESAIPLRPRGRWHRAHIGPNLALTFLTFATNFLYNAGLVEVLGWSETHRAGLLHRLPLGPRAALVFAIPVLDFSFYVAHVAMHRIPALWRFHRVHHSDPAVDVTTTIRQHPGEGIIRYAFMAAFAIPLGPTPGAFAVYRVWSVANGLLEHAHIRVPLWLDRMLSLVTTWPGMHKVHHSRAAHETNTNYGNIFSLFDRVFCTFTPAARGRDIVYGLDAFDDPATQTTAGLLALPFRETTASRRSAGVATPARARAAAS